MTCDNCEIVLHDDIHIFCLTHKTEGEAVFCSECWHDLSDAMRKEGWRSDEDEDDDNDSVCFRVEHDYDEKVCSDACPYKKDCESNEEEAKCWWCNARGVDTKTETGVWIHADCG
jgi:hypothetical protein